MRGWAEEWQISGVKRALLLLVRATLFGLLISGPLVLGIRLLERTPWNKERLYQELLNGTEREQLRAATALVQVHGERQLLEALQESGSQTRAVAKRALEYLWFNAAGTEAFHLTQAAHAAAEKSDFDKALKLLNRLVVEHSEFAEAWNQRASVYWQMGEWQKSIDDSRRAVALNPNHYGAWQGLGVCLLRVGEIEEACQCLHRALEILPHDATTRQALQECEKLLRKESPGHGSGNQLISA